MKQKIRRKMVWWKFFGYDIFFWITENQVVTKLKIFDFDKSQNLFFDNSKTQIVQKLKKLKLWLNSKTQIVTKQIFF